MKYQAIYCFQNQRKHLLAQSFFDSNVLVQKFYVTMYIFTYLPMDFS